MKSLYNTSLSSIFEWSTQVDLLFVDAIPFHAFWNIISHGHERIPWSSNFYWRRSQHNGGLWSVFYLARRERDCCNSVFSQLIYCFVMRSKLTERMQSSRARNRKRGFCIVCLVSSASQPGLKSWIKLLTYTCEREKFCDKFACASQVRWLQKLVCFLEHELNLDCQNSPI